MELRVLKYFLAVAKEGNITSAAQSLHITQPTLSKQLMDLEAEMGCQLFTRGNRKIALTDEGVFLRNRAQEIIDLADKTTSQLQSSYEDIHGSVYIGGGETEAIRIIAKTIKSMKSKFPKVTFHLYSGNADDVMEKLDKGLLDFGVFIDPTDVHKYQYIKLPFYDRWGILMRKDSPIVNKEFITPEDLKTMPLLTSRQTFLDGEFSGWLGYDFRNLDLTVSYNLLYNATLMVEEGIGYALCLDGIANTSETSSLCFKPLYPEIKAGLNIAWKKSGVLSKAAAQFIEQLKSEIE